MLLPLGVSYFAGKLLESFVDNVFRDVVTPVPGSVLYCDLALSTAEHTGIYLGNGEIAHLDGSGLVEVVSPESFLKRLDGWNTAISIYVSCRNGRAVGSDLVAERARSEIGRCRDYNLLMDNCHQFSAGCLSGNFNNSNNFFWMVKHEAEKVIGANEWRVWGGI